MPIKLAGVPKSLPKTEVKKIVSGLLENIKKTFRDSGERYNWSNLDNPVDYDILGPDLLRYASQRYTYNELKDFAEEYDCSCDAYSLPNTDLDIRIKIIENTNKKIVVSGIDFADELFGGGTIYFTVVKENGKWVMDTINNVSPEEEDMKVTWKEYHAYEKKMGETGTLVNEVTDKGRKVYVITYGDLVHKAVYAYSTAFIYDVPNEWLPKELRIPDSCDEPTDEPSTGEKLIEYQISPEAELTANIPKNGTLRVKVGETIKVKRTGSMEFYARILLSSGVGEWGKKTGDENSLIIKAVKPGTSTLSFLPLNDLELEYAITIKVE